MTYTEKLFNVTTGEETIRPYTAEEIAEVENAEVDAKAKLAEEADRAKQRAALLERLGITEDEAKLLLGQNNLYR